MKNNLSMEVESLRKEKGDLKVSLQFLQTEIDELIQQTQAIHTMQRDLVKDEEVEEKTRQFEDMQCKNNLSRDSVN